MAENHVFAYEWDESRSMVTAKANSERKSFILSIRERIHWDVERLTKIDKRLDTEATTQIYLASLDTSVVDKANDLILKSL